MSSGKRAVVVGATGAVGKQLVQALIASSEFSRVVLLGRRKIEELPENNKIEQHIIDFDNLEKDSAKFKDIDVGFCALGTTRSKSGAAGFYKVDHDYVLNTATVAKNEGVQEFVLVSSTGANENSLFLYPKTKGQVERDIAALEFKKFLIVQPGFLEAERSESRILESVARFFITPLKLVSDSIAISVENCAKAMIVGSLDNTIKGKVIWGNSELLKKAKEYKS